MRKVMLAVLALSAIGGGTIAGSAPAAAYDYAWCVQGRQTGYPGECAYTSYAQCMASASGRDASCGINPRAAYGQQQPRRGRPYRNYYND